MQTLVKEKQDWLYSNIRLKKLQSKENHQRQRGPLYNDLKGGNSPRRHGSLKCVHTKQKYVRQKVLELK